MNQEARNLFLNKAKNHLLHVRNRITDELNNLKERYKKGKQDLPKLGVGDQLIQWRILSHNNERQHDLAQLYPSPYFVRCAVRFDSENNQQDLFFAKFSFTEEKIYSWITPAAVLRFEKPGRFTYQRPDGRAQAGELLSKEQYMIVDGKIVFLSTESIDHPIELIHQENARVHKTGFVLPEIVEQMEKAQDQVIRAHHVGPFVISGPAGSGKTTLALHRVAYLVQSPETSQLYPARSIIVFVQDNNTKDYFSHLLPELGIKDVKITTFQEWALEALELSKYNFTNRFGETEEERDLYELAKLQALRSYQPRLYNKNTFSLLESIYNKYFDEPARAVWQSQKKAKLIDRIDLTLLLKFYLEIFGKIATSRDYYEELKDGRLKKKIGKIDWQYSLMIIDEFENYLPDQIKILKSCVSKTNPSILYVGDLAQQIHLGTVREWKEIGEQIDAGRQVKLFKVYRNTKSILEYIKNIGYQVEIPKEIKDGPKVIERFGFFKADELVYVEKLLSRSRDKTVGILAKDRGYLADFRNQFAGLGNVRIYSMAEAQGVEFDIVCIVGVEKEQFSVDHITDEQSRLEKSRTQRDLVYVALTRAMTELHVLGKSKLSDCI